MATKSAVVAVASDQYFTAANSASLAITGDLTFEGWFKLTSTGTAQMMASRGWDATQAGHNWWFYYTVNAMTVLISNGSTEHIDGPSWTPTAGVWYHLAFAYNAAAGRVRFYVDGTQQGADFTGFPTSINNTSKATCVGTLLSSSGGNDGVGWNGGIALCRIWNAELSAATVSASKCTIFGGAQTNMVAEWAFINDALTDASGNSNTLTNVNSATFSTSLPTCLAVTTYNQTVAATGVGASALLKSITSASTVLHGIGAGVSAMTKGVTAARTTLASTAQGIAALTKQMAVTLASTGVGIGVLTAMKVFLQTLDAVGAGVATLTKTPGKLLASTGVGIATTVKSVGKTLASTGTGVAVIVKSVGKSMAAVGQGVAVLSGIIGITLASVAQGTATMVKSVGKTLAATGVGIAVITATRGVILAATANAVATITKTAGKLLSVTARVVALIRRDFWRTKYTSQGDDYDIKYPHGD